MFDHVEVQFPVIEKVITYCKQIPEYINNLMVSSLALMPVHDGIRFPVTAKVITR